MASSRPWPFDDDDRPSGSVRPVSHANLEAILAHLNSDPELLAGTEADRPVGAVRVRATVGRPGGSAHAQGRRLRAAEWTAGSGPCPGGSPPSSGSAPVGESSAACCRPGWGWSSADWPPWRPAGGCGSGPARTPSPGDEGPWASGDRPTPRPAGAARLGGPARLGPPRQPCQHRSLGDRARWRVCGRLQAVSGSPSAGSVRAALDGRYPLALALRAVSFEADQAAQVLTDADVVVVPIVAVHGAQVPGGKVVTQGVPVVAARRLPSMLRALPAVLGPERVANLADQARVRFHAAA